MCLGGWLTFRCHTRLRVPPAVPRLQGSSPPPFRPLLSGGLLRPALPGPAMPLRFPASPSRRLASTPVHCPPHGHEPRHGCQAGPRHKWVVGEGTVLGRSPRPTPPSTVACKVPGSGGGGRGRGPEGWAPQRGRLRSPVSAQPRAVDPSLCHEAQCHLRSLSPYSAICGVRAPLPIGVFLCSRTARPGCLLPPTGGGTLLDWRAPAPGAQPPPCRRKPGLSQQWPRCHRGSASPQAQIGIFKGTE